MDFLQNLSTNFIILGSAGLLILYGLFMGHAKVKTLALSAYVGIVLTQTFGNSLADLLSGKFSSLSHQSVQLILFFAPVILLEFGRHHKAKGAHAGLLMTLILSVLTAALLVSTVLSLLDPDTLQRVMDDSQVAVQLYKLRLIWLAAVPIAVIGEPFIKNATGGGH